MSSEEPVSPKNIKQNKKLNTEGKYITKNNNIKTKNSDNTNTTTTTNNPIDLISANNTNTNTKWRSDPPIRKMPQYHKKSPVIIIKENMGENILPTWLFQSKRNYKEELNQKNFDEEILDRRNWHTKYYREYNDSIITSYTWCPVKFIEHDPDKTIYYTIVNCIDYLEHLRRKNSNNYEVEQAILELQDRFQLISIYMEDNRCFSNEKLLESISNSKFIDINIIDYLYPFTEHQIIEHK